MPWGRGSTRAWRTVRLVVLKRDRYECQIRERSCIAAASEVDHIVQPENGGTDEPSNLRAVCGACHRERSNEQAANVRRSRSTKRSLPRHPSETGGG